MTESKGRILIVDDQDGIRESMAGILELEGYEIFSYDSGFKAIEKAKETPFDVAFLDVKMPGINGVETYREIRKLRPEAVVFMMTAYAEEDLVKQALAEGAYACIYKPFEMEKILEIVETTQKKVAILVIDNEFDIREFVRSNLMEKGYKVISAATWQEALASMQQKPVDIVLLNAQLPDADGARLYEEVKRIRPDAGVVIIPSSSQDDAILEAVKKGSYAFLSKPFNRERLVDLIKKICEENKNKRTEK